MFPLLISNSLEVSLHPSLSRMQPVYSLWGFPAPPSMFPLRSVLFPRPTRIPEHGLLACQVQTCFLSLLPSPTQTQERYLSKASVYSSQTREKAPKELEEYCLTHFAWNTIALLEISH